MKVHHLNCGSMDAPGSALVCHVLLVESDRGLVLVDTGFGLRDCENPARVGPFRHVIRPAFDPAETAARQIETLGFRRTDVRHIVVTHFDFDHIGGIGDFPNAFVHVTTAEARGAVHTPSLRERIRYRSVQWAHQPKLVEHSPCCGCRRRCSRSTANSCTTTRRDLPNSMNDTIRTWSSCAHTIRACWHLLGRQPESAGRWRHRFVGMCVVPAHFRVSNLAVRASQPRQSGAADHEAGHGADRSGRDAAIGQRGQADDQTGYPERDADDARGVRTVLHRLAGVLPGGAMVVDRVGLWIGHICSLP